MTVVQEQVVSSPPEYPVARGLRWPAAVVLLLGGGLQLTEFLLEPEQSDSHARVQWWLTHGTRLQLSQALGLVAVLLLLIGVCVLWRLAREDSRRLASVALVMTASAMVGLAAVHGIELAAYWAARSAGESAAVSILDVQSPGIAGTVGFIMFLPMAVIGNLVMAVALWRSRYVPRPVAWLLVAFVLLDFVAGQGVISHATTFAQGILLAWAVVTGYQRSPRTPRRRRAD